MVDNSFQERQNWLNQRYSKTKDGQYFAHQPIYGYDSEQSEPNTIFRLARTYQLLKILKNLSFDTFLDVGGGEGYIAALVRGLFKVPSYSIDLSSEACFQAKAIFNIQSLAADATLLPLPDKSHDLVLCSEVIEHLPYPGFVFSELKRIARKYVIITTAEFSPLGELERRLRVCQLEVDYPHAERNWFTKRDFQTLFGDVAVFSSQMLDLGGEGRDYLSRVKLDSNQVKRGIEYLTSSHSIDVNHVGVIVIIPLEEEVITLHPIDIDLTNEFIKQEIFSFLLEPYINWPEYSHSPQYLEPQLTDLMICIMCNGDLEIIDERIRCLSCGSNYSLVKNIPVIIQDPIQIDADTHSKKTSDAIQNLSGGDQLRAQKINKLLTQLHGERPVCNKVFVRMLAFQMLRILWFIERPEKIGLKLKRIYRRFTKTQDNDFDQIKQHLYPS